MIFNTNLKDSYLFVITDIRQVIILAVLIFSETDYNMKVSTIAQTSGIEKY